MPIVILVILIVATILKERFILIAVYIIILTYSRFDCIRILLQLYTHDTPRGRITEVMVALE